MAIRIGTSELGGTFYTQGQAIAELFNRGRGAGDQCVVETSDASIHNAKQLDAGRYRVWLHGVQLDRPRQNRHGAVH